MKSSRLTRRSFLRSAALASPVAATIPAFLASTCAALCTDKPHAGIQATQARDAEILVLLQLAGGNDGLNTIIPVANDDYFRARPQIGIPAAQALKLSATFGLHPALAGLQSLYDSGALGIVQAVGYPNPNRSHFRSTEIWVTASDSQKVERHGWIGRYFDQVCAGADPTVGVAMGRTMPQAFAARHPTGISLENPNAFRSVDDDGPPMEASAGNRASRRAMNADVGESGASIQSAGSGRLTVDDPRAFLERTAIDARSSRDLIQRVAARVKNQAAYPAGALATNLKQVAQLIAGGLPTRVFYVSQGGYDTHTHQLGAHARLLGDLGAALHAFMADLKALGQLDRVTLLTFSEFGRRVAENQSGGTDHGAAAPVLILGGRIKPGFHGVAPSLAPRDLSNGDVRFQTDFRNVYAGLLEGWLHTPSAPILGGTFAPLKLVA